MICRQALLVSALATAVVACGAAGNGSTAGAGGANGNAGGAGPGNGGSAPASSGNGGATSNAAGPGATSVATGAGSTGATTSTSGSGGAPGSFINHCNGAHTVLTGLALAPTGKPEDALPNVNVYLATKVNPYPPNYCGKCNTVIDDEAVKTTSAADGTFTLNLDYLPYTPTVTFVVQIGRFRKVTMLPVTACQTTDVLQPARTLPGKSADGDIPKIAVSAGNSDHLDQILNAVGVTEYDCFEGRANTSKAPTCAPKGGQVIAQILVDPAMLAAYHMLFLSCAPGAYAKFATTYPMATASQNVAKWVAAGGRMFATDTAYDYIEQAFPDAITFAGAAAPPSTPQPVGGANLGCSTSSSSLYPVNVDDPTLAQWLKGVAMIPTSPVVQIKGFTQPWSVMASLAATTTKIADGSFSEWPDPATMTCGAAANIPLTAQFDVAPCGRVVYSSYHTLSSVTATLAAQEKIMEYLMFEIAGCHQ